MIICVCSTKGGVGKSTISSYLAFAFKSLEKTVLVSDLDGSINTTDLFLRDTATDTIRAKSVFNFLTNKVRDLSSLVLHSPFGIDVIPSSPKMNTIGAHALGDANIASRYRNGLRGLDYDIIIIDTPGHLGLETALGVSAADRVLIPTSEGKWENDAINDVLEKIVQTEDARDQKIPFWLVPSRVGASTAALLQAELPGIDRFNEDGDLQLPKVRVSRAFIETNPIIKTAEGIGRPFKAGSKAELQFLELAKEILHG